MQRLKLSIVGGRAFPVAGPTIWYSLPDNARPCNVFVVLRRVRNSRTIICDICPVSVNLPSAFKNISVPGLVP